MRHATLRFATVFLLTFAAHSLTHAQTRATDANAPRTNTQTPRTESSTADEDFELNIDERRINESNFHAETSVSTDGARGLQLNVGVAVRASDIDVMLRNVHGHVRFRGSLEAVLRLLDTQRVPEPRSQPAPP